MKTLYLVLKYMGLVIACYIFVVLEVGLYLMGIHRLFHLDEPTWRNVENPSLALAASRFFIIIVLLPVGWLNVFVIYKLFRQLPKIIWLMALITTYIWFLMYVGNLGLYKIPDYSPTIDAVVLVSMIGAWVAAFYFQEKIWKQQ